MPPPKDISSLSNATRQHWEESALTIGKQVFGHRSGRFFEKRLFSFRYHLDEQLRILRHIRFRTVADQLQERPRIFLTFALRIYVGLGIDQSTPFAEDTTTFRDISGHNCQFLCCGIYNLPPETDTDFDIVLITIGVLNWMPDLTSFLPLSPNSQVPVAGWTFMKPIPF